MVSWSLVILAVMSAMVVSVTPAHRPWNREDVESESPAVDNIVTPDVKKPLLPNAPEHFKKFVADFERPYSNDATEWEYRYNIFKNKLEKIDQMNAADKHAVYGITRFTDRTWKEIQNGCIFKNTRNSSYPKCKEIRDEDIVIKTVPEAWDWREHQAVTPIKDQMHCLSCYSFSATGNLEGQYAIKNKQLIEFSEQQVIDCDNEDNRCRGGYMSTVFGYWETAGAMSEKDYPYIDRNGTCTYDENKVKVKVNSCNTYQISSEEKLKVLLYSQGPLSVAIDANSVQYYSGGIMHNCLNIQLNHGVLLVGYGTENGVPYWILKNSWGKHFGENGYFRIARGTNQCGMMNRDGLITSTIL